MPDFTADQVPFEAATVEVLEQAADWLDEPAVPRQLADDEYLRAIDLCQRAVAAHGDMSGGGSTVAGHFLGKLRELLAGRAGL